jgi:hypothetical protein
MFSLSARIVPFFASLIKRRDSLVVTQFENIFARLLSSSKVEFKNESPPTPRTSVKMFLVIKRTRIQEHPRGFRINYYS